jgi:hypothetical protein
VFMLSGSLTSSPTLGVGETTSVIGSFESFIPNPGNLGLRLSLDSSDAAILKVSPASGDLSTTFSLMNFQVQAVAPGTATLTLRSSNGLTATANNDRLSVTVVRKPLQLRDIEVGNNLMATMTLGLTADVPANATVTISSSDPNRALIAPSFTAEPQAQISIANVSGAVQFYVLGLANSGTAKITATVPGVGSITATATLVPSGVGWVNQSVFTDVYATSQPVLVQTYALDPATLVPIAVQYVRKGITVQMQSDRPEIAVPANSSITLNGLEAFIIQNMAPGDAILTLIQPPGFLKPATRQRLVWHVGKPQLRAYINAPVGINTQRQFTIDELPARAKQKPMTITSANPSKLVLSTDPKTLGSGTLTVPAGTPVYAQALDNSGIVYVAASLEDFLDSTTPVQLTGTAILLMPQGSTPGGSILKDSGAYTTLFSGTTRIDLALALVDPDTGSTSGDTNVTFLPGIDPSIVVQSTNPAVGTIQGSPVRVEIGGYPRPFVEFLPVGLGDTVVTVVPPPGFTIPVNRTISQYGRIEFHVTLPEWNVPDMLPLGKDTLREMYLSLSENVRNLGTDMPITIQSSDPSRLLISSNSAAPGEPSISIVLQAGYRGFGPIYLHALDHQGVAQVAINALGLAPTRIDVPLTDTVFGFHVDPRIVLQAGVGSGGLFLATPNGGGSATVRPGASISVHIVSSDPSVLTIDTPDITFRNGMYSAQFTARPVRTGQAVVTLIPPPGFDAPPGPYYSYSSNVNVENMKLTAFGPFELGKDQQGIAQLGVESGARIPPLFVYTITSNDPERLLVSSVPTAAGDRVAFVTTPNYTVYLQALANSGTVTVTVSGQNAESTTFTVQLDPSGVVFSPLIPQIPLILSPNGPSQQAPLRLTRLDRFSLAPVSCCEDPRPGWSGTVTVSSTDPSIAVATPEVVQWPGPSPQTVTIKPGKAGTATLKLSVPTGEDTPSTGREIVVTVR